MLPTLSVAAVVFASTNIDDVFLLAAFFADPKLRPATVVVGQFFGIAAIVAVSIVAALLALALPEGTTALLGVLPLALGLYGVWQLRGGIQANEDAVDAPRHTGAQFLIVAGVTVANGGDNLGVYVPLFASAPESITLYAVVFTVMTGLWCAMGYLLVNNRAIGDHVRRYGQVALPFVLIALGLWILSGVAA